MVAGVAGAGGAGGGVRGVRTVLTVRGLGVRGGRCGGCGRCETPFPLAMLGFGFRAWLGLSVLAGSTMLFVCVWGLGVRRRLWGLRV